MSHQSRDASASFAWLGKTPVQENCSSVFDVVDQNCFAIMLDLNAGPPEIP
jgi:hypothetical protein